MGFKWFDNGLRIPIPSELWMGSLRVERVQPVARSHKVPGPGIEEKDSPQEREHPFPAAKPNAYQETEDSIGQERKPALLSRQIMASPVVSLSPEAYLEEAWELVRDRRFRHVPVLSTEGKLVGIISDRDILREAARIGNIIFPPKDEESHKPRMVRHLMNTKVLTAGPDTEIREVARVMFTERIGSMPIVNEVDQLVGIITRSDILRAMITHAPLELWV